MNPPQTVMAGQNGPVGGFRMIECKHSHNTAKNKTVRAVFKGVEGGICPSPCVILTPLKFLSLTLYY